MSEQTLKRKILRLLCSMLLLMLCIPTYAQNTAIGRDFWIGYMSRPQDDQAELNFSLTFSVVEETQSGSVTISAPNFRREYKDLERGASILFEFSQEQIESMLNLEEGSDNFGVHITSDVDLMVYAANFSKDNPNQDEGDATLILPTELLGTSYYAATHNEDPNEFNSQVMVVATQNDTWIDITPTADTRERSAGETFTINLHAGQRYQIQSKGDLTGTSVSINQEMNSGCKPFAVFAGSFTSTVGNRTSSGHMYNQMFPTQILGKSYSLIPFEKGTNEYLIKVIALDKDTEVRSNGTLVGTLTGPGDFMALTYNDLRRITTSRPVQLAQFFTGFQEQGGVLVDPFMIIASADEHMVSSGSIPETSFLGLTGTITGREFQSVILFTDEINQYVHGSPNFEQELMPFTPDPSLTFSNFYADKVLTETGSKGFIYYRYNFGTASNTPNLGVTINTGFSKLDTLSIEAENITCSFTDILFKPKFPGQDGPAPKFDIFEWDFGDGNSGEGKEVTHQYTQGGTYRVRLIASKADGFCAEPDSAFFEVEVQDFTIQDVSGAASICPNTTGVDYQVSAHEENSFIWTVSGGTIAGSDRGEAIKVDWGDTNPDAWVRVVAMNPYCDNDTVTYAVNITPDLDPDLPDGPSEICRDNLEQTYRTDAVPGSTYTWTVEEGTILSGQGTGEVQVRWNGDVAGTIWYRESNGSGSNICTGLSPRLQVVVYAPLELSYEVTDVSCYGEEDGIIALEVAGGKGPYQYDWIDHGLTTATISGLPAGRYRAIVSDAIDCRVAIVLEVNQPDSLQATLEVQHVLCNGSDNGNARVIVEGGTAPYRYFWNGAQQPAEEFNPALRAGDHSVRVLDANDCELNLNFTLTEPESLSAETTDTPTCAGENNGTIFVEASGGTPPYTYRWNTSPPQDAQLIRGLAAGIYSVTVTDANGCTFTFENEEIQEKFPVIRLPNAFSPNGDGFNDKFEGVSDCSANFEMRIYSKWGELLFYSNDISKGWDGRHRGKKVPTGTYSYMVSYGAEVNGKPFFEVQRGTVQLFR